MKSILFLLAAICVLPCLAAPFDQTLEAGGFSVHITSPNTPGKNAITLQPKGLKSVNDPVTLGVEEMIASAFLEDADSDNSPEVFLILTNPGSGSHGKVLAFSTNGKETRGQGAFSFIYSRDKIPQRCGKLGGSFFPIQNSSAFREPFSRSAINPRGE